MLMLISIWINVNVYIIMGYGTYDGCHNWDCHRINHQQWLFIIGSGRRIDGNQMG